MRTSRSQGGHTCGPRPRPLPANSWATWDDEAVGASIGARDALSLVLVDAIRNVLRGAEKVCGTKSKAVGAFVAAQPALKDLRDRLEHFDAYVVGDGFAQRDKGQPPLLMNAPSGVEIAASHSGGDDGHVVVVKVIEKSDPIEYKFPSRTATDAARALAWETVGPQACLTIVTRTSAARAKRRP